MRFYCQFYEYETEALGSDGIFILDGRNSIETMVEDCKERMRRLKTIHPDYNGFQIRRTPSGRLTSYSICWTEIRTKKDTIIQT